MTQPWHTLTLMLMVLMTVTMAPVTAGQGGVQAEGSVNLHAAPGGAAVIQTGDGTLIIKNIQGIDPEVYGALSEQYGVTESALKSFFKILEQKEVPLEDLDSTLRKIAASYKQLQVQLQRLLPEDPAVMALHREASDALEAADFARVEQLLNQASETDVKAAKQLQETATKRLLSAAASKAEIGALKLIELAYRDAAAYFRHAVDLVPQDAPLTWADYLNNCGAALVWAGDYAEARSLLLDALQIRERVLGPEHPDVALSLSNLASLHVEQDHYSQAEPLARRALHINEKTLGPKHPHVAGDLNLLASIYQQRRQYDQAEPLYERALKIDEEVLGPEHPHVAIDLNNLAVLYARQHKYEYAASAHQRALTINEKVLGPTHPSIARDLNNFAVLYTELGQLDQAEPRHQRAIALAETVLGPEHPSVVTYLKAYANTLRKFQRDAEAEPLEARVRAILNKRARTEGMSGPVSWRVTELQATKETLDGKETQGYSFVLVLKELHGVGITFGGTNQLIRRLQVGSASGEQTPAWRLPPYGELPVSFFLARPCQAIEAETCYERGLVAPAWNLMLVGLNDAGQSLQLPIDIILPALP